MMQQPCDLEDHDSKGVMDRQGEKGLSRRL